VTRDKFDIFVLCVQAKEDNDNDTHKVSFLTHTTDRPQGGEAKKLDF